MSKRLSTKLHEINANVLAHWCPACDGFHLIFLNKPTHMEVLWVWNQDAEKPTFRPAIFASDACHYYITDGNIEFLPDCKHILAGKTFSMPDIPSDELI